eukprot:scaffold17183_cov57-Attheya_sp.AAC.6
MAINARRHHLNDHPHNRKAANCTSKTAAEDCACGGALFVGSMMHLKSMASNRVQRGHIQQDDVLVVVPPSIVFGQQSEQ